MKPFHFILNISSILLFAVPVTGSEFYVSTAGNDANPGTQSSPWRTIQKAMNSATPGSTVNIKAGTYGERLVMNVSGTAGNYITFQPFGFTGLASDGTPGGASIAFNGYKTCVGDQVILDYSSLGTITDSLPFLKINNKSYVRIQGLTFQNFTCDGAFQQGVRIDGYSHDISILNNRFLHNKNIHGWLDGTAALLHIRVWASNNVTVSGNELGDIVTNMSEALTMDSTSCVNCSILSNYIHDTDGIGIDLHGGANHATIQGNLLEYTSKKRSDGTAWYGNPSIAIYVDGGNTSVIEKNLVRNSEYAFELLAEPSIAFAHDIIVRDNIAYGNDHAGIMLGNWYSNTDGSVLYNVHVLNNTIYNNGVGIVIRPYTSSSVVVENNIFSTNALTVYNGLSWPVGTMDYNLYYGGGEGPDVHRVTADPQFRNGGANSPDLSLQTSSPAKNAGDPSFVMGSGETDFVGNARVMGGRVDIGAYENQSNP
jgi:hypothetical protein